MWCVTVGGGASTFPLITFDTPGRYEWTIAVDGQPSESLPLEVIEVFSGFPDSNVCHLRRVLAEDNRARLQTRAAAH